ncbi:cysteine proteinase [Thermothelomyces heterothallicus CBS 203.75]
MASAQVVNNSTGETALESCEAASSLPLRRSGRARKRPSGHGEDSDYKNGKVAASPVSSDSRRNPKRRAAPDAFNVPEHLLEASLGPWKENEQSEWPSWVELESDPAFFTAIMGLLGVKGARIEEVLSVDEDTLATLPPPVHGLVFLYEYVADQSPEVTYPSQDVWFANQTTHNACATIALLNIIMNAEGLSLGEKLRNFKQESKDLSPPLRGNMINNSTWIRVAHNSFARRLDLLDAALSLQNEVDNKEKRARSSAAMRRQRKKRPKKERVKAGKSGDTPAYHFIAFVPVGQQVWQLDGLSSAPVCIGKSLSSMSFSSPALI